MRRLPPLVEMRAFEAAARLLSFKRAAAELNVTPTAISHQIRLLEQFCGQSLFRRRPRPLSLTTAGEQLFPVVRDSLDNMSEALLRLQSGGENGRLHITGTNAFCVRWLLPRLHDWRKLYPPLKLTIAGTDSVLNLNAGESDVAIRYAAKPPEEGPSFRLLRDTFHVVASPRLVGRIRGVMDPAEFTRYPLIEAEWPATDVKAPTWRRWQRVARARHGQVPDLAAAVSVNFKEELHAIEAAVAGYGIAICSDALIAGELARGDLVPLSRLTLPGYGFYIVHRPGHSKLPAIRTFIEWAHSAR